MRRLLRDRVSAGVIAVLAAYLFLIQAAFSGFASGAIAASAGDPLRVICAQMDALSVAPDGDASVKADRDCPCATLCRLASAAMTAVLDGPSSLPVRSSQVASTPTDVTSDPVLPVARGLIGKPRAPPSISI